MFVDNIDVVSVETTTLDEIASTIAPTIYIDL